MSNDIADQLREAGAVMEDDLQEQVSDMVDEEVADALGDLPDDPLSAEDVGDVGRAQVVDVLEHLAVEECDTEQCERLRASLGLADDADGGDSGSESGDSGEHDHDHDGEGNGPDNDDGDSSGPTTLGDRLSGQGT